ncbi:MAG: Uma2 family endonuclease [Myxococcota bacterium]
MASVVSPGPGQQMAPALPLKRFTVEEYHRMIRAGVFTGDDRFELLEGLVISKMVRNPPHDVTLLHLTDALRSRVPAGWHLRPQMAITTSDSEPEPDIAIVRGEVDDYLESHPRPEDIALLVEVAESTLERDRVVKGAIYARANIRTYWIINLVDFKVEVYTNPSGPTLLPAFGRHVDFGRGEAVPLEIAGTTVKPIGVDEVLRVRRPG